MHDSVDAETKVSNVQPITPHNQALYEAGKKLLEDSIDAGREFCKFMITTSTAGIPIYLALLKVVLPETYRPTMAVGVFLLLPAITFLVAAIVSVTGYLPRVAAFSLDLPGDIDKARTATIERRRKFALIAVALFTLAAIADAAIAVWALSLETDPRPATEVRLGP